MNRLVLQEKDCHNFNKVTVVVAFFVCWAPYHSQRLLFLYVSLYGEWTETLRKINQDLFTLSGCFYYFNSTINPVLYTVMSNRFRVAFREMLCADNPCTLRPVFVAAAGNDSVTARRTVTDVPTLPPLSAQTCHRATIAGKFKRKVASPWKISF
ncbi:neuropeptides capa receptor [Caerostris extrusa]|uniref:Neuropeptides capa receptor n=1 Tax=Caerostris extrusa TaxID=172846 RepID=A0AAV4VJ79_CAEEX|nr:neuropeptides capa receptor [Caerostris extrusa]